MSQVGRKVYIERDAESIDKGFDIKISGLAATEGMHYFVEGCFSLSLFWY